MNKPLEERRKYQRIYRHFIMSYHEKGKHKAIYHVSQVNNVSQGGLNFSSTHLLKTGAILLVALKVPFIADTIRLEGIVLQCKEKVPDLIYEIRLQFQDMPDEVLKVLEKIESCSKKKI